MKITIAIDNDRDFTISYEIIENSNGYWIEAKYSHSGTRLFPCFSINDALHFMADAIHKALSRGVWRVIDVTP